MSEQSLTHKITELIELSKIMKSQIEVQEKFLQTLEEKFGRNPYYSKEYEQGLSVPHSYFSFHKGDQHKCYNQDNSDAIYPHLYHSFNPQLNNISDMIRYLLDHCCCKENQQPKESILDQKIDEIDTKQKDICIKIDDLLRYLSKDKCLTLEELSQFLRGEEKHQIIITDDKQKKEISEFLAPKRDFS